MQTQKGTVVKLQTQQFMSVTETNMISPLCLNAQIFMAISKH